MEKRILIASATPSEDEYIPVARNLEARGYQVIIYNSDKVMSGEDNFFLNIDSHGTANVSYNGYDISPDSIVAGWYRKVADFDPSHRSDEKAKLLLLRDEIENFHQTIWGLYSDKVWLNSPLNMRNAGQKLAQLVTAQQVGFTTPETIISSNWDQIIQKLFHSETYEQIIVKMIGGVIVDNNQNKALTTTVLTEKDVERLQEYTTPFPGLYQPYVEKAREWRVTVVGEKIFPAAIYTDIAAKDDWRKHHHTDLVKFKSEAFPESVGEQCYNFLKKMQLKFGAFDFIEDHDGNITFLECNANGQYYWLEEYLGLPISSAITDELIKISEF